MENAWESRLSGKVAHADDARLPFEVDYARIVHSGSFRRLQGKTQILSLGEDDFYRTRLTHSMEVAQVAEGIVQHLRGAVPEGAERDLLPSTALIHAVGLSHDLGHPPFGHGGETALNYCMRGAGGFEGNAQTLRILARLEHYSDDFGADLTRRSLLGILKYPATRDLLVEGRSVPRLAEGPTMIRVLDAGACKPIKACYDEDAWIVTDILEPLCHADRERFLEVAPDTTGRLRTVRKSFDCSIMDVADDIAYGVHDLEDAIALGFVTEEAFRASIDRQTCGHLLAAIEARPLGDGPSGGYDGLVARLFGLPRERKGAIGRLVHHFIKAVVVVPVEGFVEPLLSRAARMERPAAHLLGALQALVVAEVIDHPRVQQLEFKGQRMVVEVFEALASDPARLLPSGVRRAFEEAESGPRVLADHVASFTDAALVRTYDRLFSPRSGSLFDRI